MYITLSARQIFSLVSYKGQSYRKAVNVNIKLYVQFPGLDTASHLKLVYLISVSVMLVFDIGFLLSFGL